MAQRNYLVSIDLKQNQLLQGVLQNVGSIAALPGSPVEGQLAYVNDIGNSVHRPYYYDGTQWIDFYGGIEEIRANGGLKFSSGTGTDTIVNLAVEVDDTSLEVTAGDAGLVQIKAAGVLTSHIADATSTTTGVTLPKLQWIDRLEVLGRMTAGTGAVEKVKVNTLIDGEDDASLVTEGAVFRFVNAAITALGALVGDWDASVNTFPVYGVGGTPNIIESGDYWYITATGDMGGHHVTAGDVLYAKVQNPGQTGSNWFVVEANYYQATYTEKGIARIATSAEAITGVDEETIISPFTLKAAMESFHSLNGVTSTGFDLIGNDVATSYDCDHNYGTNDVEIKMIDSTTQETVEAQYVRTSINRVTVSMNRAPTTGQNYRIVIIGRNSSI